MRLSIGDEVKEVQITLEQLEESRMAERAIIGTIL